MGKSLGESRAKEMEDLKKVISYRLENQEKWVPDENTKVMTPLGDMNKKFKFILSPANAEATNGSYGSPPSLRMVSMKRITQHMSRRLRKNLKKNNYTSLIEPSFMTSISLSPLISYNACFIVEVDRVLARSS